LAARAKANGILARMLGGERPVKLVVRPETAAGKVTVHLDLLEISGVPLSGTLLNLAAELIISRVYEDIKIGEPFEIGHNVDHAVIQPTAVRIFIGAQPAPKPAAR
jgi:hypothetical protein